MASMGSEIKSNSNNTGTVYIKSCLIIQNINFISTSPVLIKFN